MTDITFTTSEIIQLREYETVIERGLNTFMDVGEALLGIRDRRLYRNTHPTFEDYCQHRWGFTRQHGNRLIAAAETVRRLEPIGSIPTTESQVRPLVGLDPDDQQKVWQRAVETAPEGTITARHVQEVVNQHRAIVTCDVCGNVYDKTTSDVCPYCNHTVNQRISYLEQNHIGQPTIDEETGEILSPTNGNGNGRRLPQLNRPSDLEEPQGFDDCQTPPYALGPLLPYLNPEWTIWEPARGDGQLVDALYAGGYSEGLVSSSIQDGQNFFHYEPPQWDCLVTNPPYSIKYPWLKHCYELSKPFALLLPVMTLGAAQAQELFARYGVQIIFMSPRVDFKMPNLGYEGNGAQFPTAWFTWQLSLPCDMLFVNIKEAKKAFVGSLEFA